MTTSIIFAISFYCSSQFVCIQQMSNCVNKYIRSSWALEQSKDIETRGWLAIGRCEGEQENEK